MIPFIDIINKYYLDFPVAKSILITHSTLVANKAIAISEKHPELKADNDFIHEAAMLHDIGIFLTDGKEIGCSGSLPYICHGYKGYELLMEEKLPKHALVCERHTGCGLSITEIIEKQIPLPHREMIPVSIEEQIICYADKFYSKTEPLERTKSIDKIFKQMAKHGFEQVDKFKQWHELFS